MGPTCRAPRFYSVRLGRLVWGVAIALEQKLTGLVDAAVEMSVVIRIFLCAQSYTEAHFGSWVLLLAIQIGLLKGCYDWPLLVRSHLEKSAET